MPKRILSINRSPVLTLWAAVVAQRLGFDEDESLTLGIVRGQRRSNSLNQGGDLDEDAQPIAVSDRVVPAQVAFRGIRWSLRYEKEVGYE
jgi:hypothetical protein